MKDVNVLFGMVDHCNVEAMAMRWFKRGLWKAGIVIASMLLLLILMAWVPASAASAHEGASGSATPGTVTVQATPTEDATVTALNKEKLEQEVQQLKEQNELDLFGWLRTNASILLSTLVVVIGGLIGLWRWLADRRDAQDKELKNQQNEREKRAEERFQATVEGLGSTDTATQIGASIMLRTFLRPGYEHFYSQVFDLAVAYLRLRNIGSEPEPPDSLNQALIRLFRESFPLARDLPKQSSQSLEALGIRLDSAYLTRSDLRSARMPESYLRKANLHEADLRAVNLREANLSGANLGGADLREANLRGADLREANLSRTNLEHSSSLKNTKLYGVTGLTKEQLEACKAKGAIIDEDTTTSPPQSTVSPSRSSQSNATQASSAPPAQGNAPPLDTSGRSDASSNPGPEL